jgi:CBS domain-containing protein
LGHAAVARLDDPIADAAKAMRDHRVGCLVVVDEDEVCGVITERDIVVGCVVEGHASWECQVFRHMTVQSMTVHSDMALRDAATILMIRTGISQLPVRDGDRIVGLVSSTEIMSEVKLRVKEPWL